jgi:hypothetical protein
MERVPNSVPTRLKAAAVGDHPDPDLLAALAEQALPERERAQVLLHLSRCAECRDVLALAIPPVAAASPSLDTGRRSWFQWPVLRWAAAGACVVIVGSAVLMKRDAMMSMRDMRRVEPTVALQKPADVMSDQAPSAQAPPPPAQSTSAPSAAPEAEPKSAVKRLEESRSLAGASAEASKQKRDAAAVPWGGPKSAAAGAGIAGQISALKTGRVFASAPNRVPGPAAPSANAQGYESNVQNRADKFQNGATRKDSLVLGGSLADLSVTQPVVAQAAPQKETVEVTAASPAMQTEAVAEAREKRKILGKAKTSSNGLLLDQVQANDQAQTNELNELISDADSADKATLAKKAVHGNSAYSPVSRWTISSDGQLQHSIDTGKTWQPVAVAEKVTFRALSANGPDIWVGGAAGQLYHSTDSGSHWTQVKPEFGGASLSGDIAAIEFTDIRQGKVTTANGEIWITDDGGKTWRKQS